MNKQQKEYRGIDFRGKNSFAWKGGRITQNGYILLFLPEHPNSNSKGYIQEHRWVVEGFIGRKLNKKEVVHHLDFNRKNNDINNLMLFKNSAEHSKFHAKLRQFKMTNPIRRQIENRWKNP